MEGGFEPKRSHGSRYNGELVTLARVGQWEPAPTGAQRWVHRHRTPLRVVSLAGVLMALSLAAYQLLQGDGALSALVSLSGGAGFLSMLVTTYSVQRFIERRDVG